MLYKPCTPQACCLNMLPKGKIDIIGGMNVSIILKIRALVNLYRLLKKFTSYTRLSLK